VPPSQWPSATGTLLLLLGLGEAAGPPHGPGWRVALALLAGASLPLAVAALTGSRARDLDPPARALWAVVLVLPGLIVLGDVVSGSHTIFVSKTCFLFLPLLLLGVVRAWTAAPWPRLGRVMLAAWALLLAAASLSVVHTRANVTNDFEWLAGELKQSDDPGHRLVLSSGLRGYVVPLLLQMRQAGVGRLRLAYVPESALSGYLDAALGDPDVTRLSLVRLSVPYGPDQPWSRERLTEAARSAEERGVRVRRGRRRSAPRDLDPGARLLWIVGPLQVKYFSR
jgi:hypothetical protein